MPDGTNTCLGFAAGRCGGICRGDGLLRLGRELRGRLLRLGRGRRDSLIRFGRELRGLLIRLSRDDMAGLAASCAAASAFFLFGSGAIPNLSHKSRYLLPFPAL